MEKVALNNFQLDHLAQSDPKLSQVFYRTVPCDKLPSLVLKEGPTAYIVNTDPSHEPGRHWIALWTEANVCQVMDSYGVSLVSLKHRIIDALTWKEICETPCQQDTWKSRPHGIYDLLHLY